MLNKVQLIGNVGKDPEIRQLEKGKLASFSIATSETFKRDNGEKVTNTEWHKCIIFGNLANVVENYVNKGSKIYIEGKLRHRSYEKDGITMYITEILCNSLLLLSPKQSENRQTNDQLENYDESNEDMPF